MVVRYLLGGIAKTDAAITTEATMVNGSPALAFRVDGDIDGIMAAQVETGRITGLYFIRNPQKLTRIASQTPLTLR